MSIGSFGQDFPQPQVGITEPKTGVLTRDGRYLLLTLYNRTGAGTGIVPNVSDPLIAAGASIADALQLTTDWNLFGTVAAGTGCQILPLKPGNDIQVYNGGANALNIYPPTALDQIDALGAGVAYSLPAGKLRIFECWAINPGLYLSYGN